MADLRGAKVTDRISRYGTITILYGDMLSVDDGGEIYFCSELLNFVGLRARVAGGVLEVLKGRLTVARIPGRKLVRIDLQDWESVLSNGWLYSDFFQDTRFKKRFEEALNLAESGRKPGLYDNSPFARVDKKLAGRSLFVLENLDKTIAVFTKRGERVNFVIGTPLAFKRWGRRVPRSEGM